MFRVLFVCLRVHACKHMCMRACVHDIIPILHYAPLSATGILFKMCQLIVKTRHLVVPDPQIQCTLNADTVTPLSPSGGRSFVLRLVCHFDSSP